MLCQEHCIYLAISDSWWDFDKNQRLVKVGSSSNPYARIRSFQTANPYPVELVGHFKIQGFNCYKLDNIVKIQLNDQRTCHRLRGGTEFYHDVTEGQLEKLFMVLGIKFVWIKHQTKDQCPEVSDRDMIAEQDFCSKIQKNEIHGIHDFDKVNILLCPVPKSSTQMFINYTATIVNGISNDLFGDELNDLACESDSQIFTWGNSVKSLDEWERMMQGDYVFIISSKDNKITILQVIKKINSQSLSQSIWTDKSFPLIYILDKIRIIEQNVSDFLIKYCGYKDTIKNIQGNMILNKGKQRESMIRLSDIMIQ
jgi:hypothetical protein